jgi:hypothetical protein
MMFREFQFPLLKIKLELILMSGVSVPKQKLNYFKN